MKSLVGLSNQGQIWQTGACLGAEEKTETRKEPTLECWNWCLNLEVAMDNRIAEKAFAALFVFSREYSSSGIHQEVVDVIKLSREFSRHQHYLTMSSICFFLFL